MINARAETVNSKSAYRNAFKHRRCLIPAEGFYAWKAGKAGKTPFLIRRDDDEPLAMAGLWERWHGEDEQVIESGTIVVTDANDRLRPVHDRMPVIPAPGDSAGWLDTKKENKDKLLAMLKPASSVHWSMHPVSWQVNSPRNDGPELLEAVATQ
jgi:putative SOS response-associated peptidase YedK